MKEIKEIKEAKLWSVLALKHRCAVSLISFSFLFFFISFVLAVAIEYGLGNTQHPAVNDAVGGDVAAV